MVRVKKEWLLHKNVVTPYKGDSRYKCGAPVEDRGDITDKQALQLPRCAECFDIGKELVGEQASARGGESGEADVVRPAAKQVHAPSSFPQTRMVGWL